VIIDAAQFVAIILLALVLIWHRAREHDEHRRL